MCYFCFVFFPWWRHGLILCRAWPSVDKPNDPRIGRQGSFLLYYGGPNDREPKGAILVAEPNLIDDATVAAQPFAFSITTYFRKKVGSSLQTRVFLIAADTGEEKEEWMAALLAVHAGQI